MWVNMEQNLLKSILQSQNHHQIENNYGILNENEQLYPERDVSGVG